MVGTRYAAQFVAEESHRWKNGMESPVNSKANAGGVVAEERKCKL